MKARTYERLLRMESYAYLRWMATFSPRWYAIAAKLCGIVREIDGT